MKKIFILTGEPSGDKLASTVISKLKLEKYLLSETIKKKASSTILRYFNVAGADLKNRTCLILSPDNLIPCKNL